jgi:hypothetical protein
MQVVGVHPIGVLLLDDDCVVDDGLGHCRWYMLKVRV